MDDGPVHAVHTFPAWPPGGTRPATIPPTIAPRQNGTTTDEIANAAPKSRCSASRGTTLRNANPEPRATIPSTAIDNGTNIVNAMDENTVGNPVQSTTRQKINQTWFASHTGPMA